MQAMTRHKPRDAAEAKRPEPQHWKVVFRNRFGEVQSLGSINSYLGALDWAKSANEESALSPPEDRRNYWVEPDYFWEDLLEGKL